MGTIKDRNGKDLTEAEEIKKRWQEDTEKLYQKGLNDPDNHDGHSPRARHPGMMYNGWVHYQLQVGTSKI